MVGGPQPGAAAPAPRFVVAGGAPGITASLGREGDWTLIVLSNLDRAMMPKVEERLRDELARVRE